MPEIPNSEVDHLSANAKLGEKKVTNYSWSTKPKPKPRRKRLELRRTLGLEERPDSKNSQRSAALAQKAGCSQGHCGSIGKEEKGSRVELHARGIHRICSGEHGACPPPPSHDHGRPPARRARVRAHNLLLLLEVPAVRVEFFEEHPEL